MMEKLLYCSLLWIAFLVGRWITNQQSHKFLKEIRLVVADELWKMIWNKNISRRGK